jgi:hypothetical protein
MVKKGLKQLKQLKQESREHKSTYAKTYAEKLGDH